MPQERPKKWQKDKKKKKKNRSKHKRLKEYNNEKKKKNANLSGYINWEWVLNSFFIPDPFKMHRDDGLEDLLFLPSGTTDASAFTEPNDPLKNSYGTTSPTGFMS